MGIEHLSLSDSAESALEVLNSNGAVIIDNILNQKDLKEIKADLNPYLELADVNAGKQAHGIPGEIAKQLKLGIESAATVARNHDMVMFL